MGWDELAYPMPKAPPVTTATLPLRSWISFLGPTIGWSTDCIVLMIRGVKGSTSGLIEFQLLCEQEKEKVAIEMFWLHDRQGRPH